MKNTPIKICRKCGRPIYIIHERLYRTIVVDADALEVVVDPLGDEFVRWDGSKLRARAIGRDEIVEGAEFAYRPHAKTCGVVE